MYNWAEILICWMQSGSKLAIGIDHFLPVGPKVVKNSDNLARQIQVPRVRCHLCSVVCVICIV